MNEVVIKFDNIQQAQTFMQWLELSGEKEYFATKDFESQEERLNYAENFTYDYQNLIISI